MREHTGADQPDSDPRTSRLTRRTALGLLGAGSLATAAGVWTAGGGGTASGAMPALRPTTAAERVGDRLLVVVELNGGNDGLATVSPTADGRLRDLRPDLLQEPGAMLAFSDDHELHPGLAPLTARPLAVAAGLGTIDPSGSHFEMETRWWQGDVAGDRGLRTGFLGRVCDQLHDDAPVTGFSVGTGASPALLGERATTIALPEPGIGWFLEERDRWFANLRAGLERLASAVDDETMPTAASRRGLGDALVFAEILGSVDAEGDTEDGYPDTDLGWRCRTAAAVLAADAGARVAHIPFGGFDTHSDQRWQHDELITDLGASLGALLDDLERRGLAERTLVVTTSEFGRRPEQNAGGTDHGTAAPALLCGPVTDGVHGEAPRLDRLDDNGNLVTTSPFDDYYATIAESWFGVPATDVLPGGRPTFAAAIAS